MDVFEKFNSTGPAGAGVVKKPLSTSYYGLPVEVGTTATTIHTFSKGVFEEVYLWASNIDAGDINLTMSYDSGFSGADQIIVPVTGQGGLTLVYPGIPGTSDENQTNVLYCKTGSSSKLAVTGFVVRHFPLNSPLNNNNKSYYNRDITR